MPRSQKRSSCSTSLGGAVMTEVDYLPKLRPQEEVCSHKTGHAEAVHVEFDPN
ncbi:MAG: hypothetical protein WBP64_20200 [Nitrososphaeraceae archaeon]